jgi:hypothetical protein
LEIEMSGNSWISALTTAPMVIDFSRGAPAATAASGSGAWRASRVSLRSVTAISAGGT